MYIYILYIYIYIYMRINRNKSQKQNIAITVVSCPQCTQTNEEKILTQTKMFMHRPRSIQ